MVDSILHPDISNHLVENGKITKKSHLICIIAGVPVDTKSERLVTLICAKYTTGLPFKRCTIAPKDIDNPQQIKKIMANYDYILDHLPAKYIKLVYQMYNSKGPASCKKCRYEIPDIGSVRHFCPLEKLEEFMEMEDEKLVQDFNNRRHNCPQCGHYVCFTDRPGGQMTVFACRRCRSKRQLMEKKGPQHCCNTCDRELSHQDACSFMVNGKEIPFHFIDENKPWELKCEHCKLTNPSKKTKLTHPDCARCDRKFRTDYGPTQTICRSCLLKENTTNVQQLMNFLDASTTPCEMCDSTVHLECDHKDPLTKEGSLVEMAIQGVDMHAIQQELQKCRRLCHTCHGFVTNMQSMSGLRKFKELQLDRNIHMESLNKMYGKLRRLETMFGHVAKTQTTAK